MAQKCGRAGGVCGRRAWGGCGASESRTCPNLLNARSIDQVFDGAACVRRFGNLLNRCEHLTGAVVRQTILVRHAIQSVDARRGGALEVKKTPAQCCEHLTGHEGAMFQRVRLAGPIPRQCPYCDCNRPPWCIWSDEEKRWLRELAARHVPHGICLKGSGPMLGLSFDAEQGCWWSVCIHGRSRCCRLLKTFVVVIGKPEHEAARRILM